MSSPVLTITPVTGIPFIQPGDDLAEIIFQSLTRMNLDLVDGDILVVTSKIVSKAEGRQVNLVEVQPSQAAIQLAGLAGKDPRLVELILGESSLVLRCKAGTIIVEHRLGFVCANAGIDHSNVCGGESQIEDWVLLLPEDPQASAHRLRHCLEERSAARLGVLIIDSHGRAWRLGTVGMAIGLSGMPGLVDLRGVPDLFGYNLQITQVGAADELAAAASLMIGQAAEATPAAHVRGFPYALRDGSLRELLRPREEDLFR